VPSLAVPVLSFALWAQNAVGQGQSRVDEYRLKAAFIFHFTELVEWPAAVLGAAPQPVTICTLGEDAVAQELDATVAGKTVGSRPLHVRHLSELQEFPGCQILFISDGESTRTPLLLARLKNAAVLSVGETEEFVKQGGMIGLSVEGKRVRLDVNLDASRRVGIKISSRLLLLAKNVIGGRP